MNEPITSALAAAARGAFTRPIPKTAAGQIGFLGRQAKGSPRKLSELLGVSPQTARRYLKGTQKPSKATAERLRQETERRWQPRVQAAARKRAGQAGLVVELRARIGYTAPVGSSDDGRTRRITAALPPEYADRLLGARTEEERSKALSEGVGYTYFQERGRRAHELGIQVAELDYIDVEFL